MALKLIRKQLELVHNELRLEDGFSAGPIEDDLLHWQASIQGPAESPYAGGQFWLRIQFSADYPLKPPKHRILLNVGVTPQENFLDDKREKLTATNRRVYYSVWFSTKIFHPNVDDKGKICVDFLLSEWKPSFTVTYILQALCSLMLHPNADNPAVPQIADMYRKDRNKFDATARQWTEQYAGLHQS